MAPITFCSGTTAQGRRCTQKIWGEPEPWFCWLHRAQAGIGKPANEKAMASAQWPGYLPEEVKK